VFVVCGSARLIRAQFDARLQCVFGKIIIDAPAACYPRIVGLLVTS
jgi:hypothetical protein